MHTLPSEVSASDRHVDAVCRLERRGLRGTDRRRATGPGDRPARLPRRHGARCCSATAACGSWTSPTSFRANAADACTSAPHEFRHAHTFVSVPDRPLADALAELLGNASIEITVREAPALAEAAVPLAAGTCVYVPSLPARPLGSIAAAAGRHSCPRARSRAACGGAAADRRRAVGISCPGGGTARRAPRDADRRRRRPAAGPLARQRRAAGQRRAARGRRARDRHRRLPRGSPEDHSGRAVARLRRQAAPGQQQGLGAYAITQFSFAPERIVALGAELPKRAPQAAVYVGMPGPSDPLQLLRYAQRCGVGAARRALSTLGTQIARLMSHTEPSDQLAAATRYAQSTTTWSACTCSASAAWCARRAGSASAPPR